MTYRAGESIRATGVRQCHDFAQINEAIAGSEAGRTIKPVLRISA